MSEETNSHQAQDEITQEMENLQKSVTDIAKKEATQRVKQQVGKSAKKTLGKGAEKGAKAGGKALGKGAKAGGKALGKGAKAGGKALGKLAIKGIVAGGKALLVLIKLIIAFIVPITIIAIILAVSYFVIIEFKGAEQEYSKDIRHTNQIEQREDKKGYGKTTDKLTTAENKVIRDFYKYFAFIAYKQISIKDGKTLITKDHPDAVSDYYDREKDFALNKDLLYSADEYVNERFKHPEQLIQPVCYTEEETEELDDNGDKIIKYELCELVDEKNRLVIVDSFKRDETGKKTDEKFKSVRDYGLGSVFKYIKAERITYVQGTYVEDSEYNASTDTVVSKPSDEAFNHEMKREDIHLIKTAITMAGVIEYEYEIQATRVSDFTDGASGDPATDFMTITRNESFCKGEGEEAVCKSVQLYKKRSNDTGGVFVDMPVIVGVTLNGKALPPPAVKGAGGGGLGSVGAGPDGEFTVSADATGLAKKVVEIALSRNGMKYVYGTAGPSTFDCSGLMQWSYKQIGINLPRVSREQAKGGKAIALKDINPGDIVAFNTMGSGVSHVGMYIGNDMMVHAPNKRSTVKVESLSKYYKPPIAIRRYVVEGNAQASIGERS